MPLLGDRNGLGFKISKNGYLPQNLGFSNHVTGIRRTLMSIYGPRVAVSSVLVCLLFVLYLSFQLSSVDSSGSCHCDSFSTTTETMTTPGGSPHKLCVVVPYRDRFEELQIFAPYLHDFLSKQNMSHEILILNQFDQYRFNRAALINVGYFEAKKRSCDYLVMHDVDLLPKNAQLVYKFPPKNAVFHVASPKYHPKYDYPTFIGGILIVSLENFWKVNGMSNRYWGWGLEDDEFYLRLKEAQLEIQRPENLTTNKDNTFLHIHDRRLRKRDTRRIGDQKRVSRRRDRVSGVESVQYQVLSRVAVKIEHAHLLVINAQLECDKQFSPWCQA